VTVGTTDVRPWTSPRGLPGPVAPPPADARSGRRSDRGPRSPRPAGRPHSSPETAVGSQPARHRPDVPPPSADCHGSRPV